MQDIRLIELGAAALAVEAGAVSSLIERLGDEFIHACTRILDCQGHLVVTGLGKSGHVAAKMAATFASTGTPAFYLHPGDACHGDMGMITQRDLVIAVSYSGETAEILLLLAQLVSRDIPVIALTGNPDSTLAKTAIVHLDVSVEKEACPLGLAPTASTTAALAMGDALAVAVLAEKGFTAADFARRHPAGALGKKLLFTDAIMRTGEDIPRAFPRDLLATALMEITKKGAGLCVVTDEAGYVVGVFTDGDLRRCIERRVDIHSAFLVQVMTRDFCHHPTGTLAAEALATMRIHQISALPVVDDKGILVGLITLKDLIQAGAV